MLGDHEAIAMVAGKVVAKPLADAVAYRKVHGPGFEFDKGLKAGPDGG